MAEFSPEIVEEVVAACQASLGEAAEAIGRALDLTDAKLAVGEPATLAAAELPATFNNPGLAVVLTVETAAAVFFVPQVSGITPYWCPNPDPTGSSKLQTLAQELGMTLLPEQFMPMDFGVGWVKSLAEATKRGGVADGAAMLPLELAAGEANCQAMLIWPAKNPSAVLCEIAEADAKNEEPVAEAAEVASETPEPDTPPKVEPDPVINRPTPSPPSRQPPDRPKSRVSVGDLPVYSRSLLKIEVPVVVTLAEKRQPLGKIIELCPGAIIHFDKSCEEMLDLKVGGHHVATGEAVKVGDKFGLRITSMVLPDERFIPVTAAK